MTPARPLSMILWTADVALAAEADAAGIDRIGCDLEREGKSARQADWGTWVSDHQIDDLPRIRAVLRQGRLFARPDPFDGSRREQLDAVLAAGAEVVMLPVAEDPDAIAHATRIVSERACLVALIETRRGVEAIEEIASVDGLGEIFLGPNDLSASLGLANRFEALVVDEAERVAAATHAAGLPFGIGGLAAVGDTRASMPPELVYAQLARLGATGTILGRFFIAAPGALVDKVSRARRLLSELGDAPAAQLAETRVELARRARELERI